MTEDNSARRYLALWLPIFSADRWLHERASAPRKAEDDRPLVFVDKVKGASRLVAVDALARARDLLPGLSLADARARVPALKAVTCDVRADANFLAKLADAALAFTPSVALDEPDGLALDITGCAHLFSGEAGLVARLGTMLRSSGVSGCRIAVASTPDMARALARFGPKNPVFAHDDSEVRALPVTALECNAEDTRALRRAGLKTIGAVADRPSVLFAARFTPAFTTKLARVLGEEDRRITSRRTPPVHVVDHCCAEPVLSGDVIERIVNDLAQRMAKLLDERGEGGRVFEAIFFRTDGAVRRIRVETSLPTRDPAVVLRLYRDRLDEIADPLDAGFGFDRIRLHVLRSEPCRQAQTTLDARDEQHEQLSQLIDRLGSMFGGEHITRLRPVDTHIPERAQMRVPAGDIQTLSAWMTPQDDAPPVRPLHLFERPHPIEIAGDADEPSPARFRWRRVLHDVAHAEGPERIADEWWNPPSGFGTRDYFRVETLQGRRFWIFRAGATAAGQESQWFLHGIFP